MMSCVLLWKLHIKTFIIGPKIHLELISVCKGWDKVVVHFFYVWIASIPAVFIEKASGLLWKPLSPKISHSLNHVASLSEGLLLGSLSPLFHWCPCTSCVSTTLLGISWFLGEGLEVRLWVFQWVLLQDCSGLLFRFVAFPRKRSDLSSFHIKSCRDDYWDCLVSIVHLGNFHF